MKLMFGNIHRLKLNNNMSSTGGLESGRVAIDISDVELVLSKSRNPEVHCSSPANKKQAYPRYVTFIDHLDYHTHDKAISSYLRPKSRYSHTSNVTAANNANLNEAILLRIGLLAIG